MRSFAEIGAAVVGTGFIGAVHVEALRRLGVQVHGVVGSTRERAAARAVEIGLPQAYGSFQAMLDDPRVDVVHVTSPNHLHHEHSRAALRAGKHVVCEKPLAMTPAESADLLQIAEHSGLVHATNFNLRFYPVVQHVHGMVREGALGEVRLVSGHYLQDWLLLDTDWNWRLEPELGGVLRAVSDIGSHWMDLTTFLTGKRIVAVMADLATFIKKRRQPSGPMETFATGRGVKTVERDISTEDCATILLRYEDGTRGAVTVSQISAGRKNSLLFEVDGSTSAVGWNSERPDELWIGHRGRPNELLLRDPAILNEEGRRAASLPGGHAEGFADTFRALYAAVYRAVSAGKPSEGYPTFADGHDEMLVCDAVARSHREQRWVEVERAVRSAAR
ncbi:MAG: dehydrogenase [Chloroflexi bacterium 13_1_40CM_4_65_16]|nr:MAG: dehydrogenase [Chloroflexi bacterium 13_1_40CM_4_65_16]OLE72559.1 MAG: dehydrogenase [Actinobacteria bacterium 13_1_20CM_2_66_18]TMF64361.1 MAG: Gfo/Idh/MocA family oxidoreductase [Chloroflexota bacterium]TMF87925.1 MAG: Gfo/Idh/MocA family oxidoreductase [Chloroflexota bacterium]TMG10283.1 MAG: Gfo/Idh/MocA family oxidoreductase [Chloroflexota bacterium]